MWGLNATENTGNNLKMKSDKNYFVLNGMLRNLNMILKHNIYIYIWNETKYILNAVILNVS